MLLALTAVRLAVAALAGLAEDEAYYRLWGLFPAIAYYDHAPMIGWWIAAGIGIAGDGPLGIRLLVPLATCLGSLALWQTGTILFGGAAGTWAALLFNAMLLIAAGSVLATPDAPSVLFWGLSLAALAELLRSGRPVWWLVVGLAAGLGLLSKYTNLFLGAGILLWLLAEPAGRRWLLSWQVWAGGALAVLLFFPVVAWNAEHDWVSFAKQFGRAVPDRGFALRYLGEFLGAEILLLNPLTVGLAAWALKQAPPSAPDLARTGRRLLLLTSLPFLVYLLVHALHDRVQPNWIAPLAPALALLAGAGARSLTWPRKIAAAAVALGAAATALLYVHAVAPLSTALGAADPTAQMRGWQELGAEVEAAREKAGAAWIATESYGVAAQLAAVLPRVPVIQLDERIRYLHMPAPDPNLLSQPALLVDLERRVRAERLEERFAAVEPLDVVERRAGGKVLARYRLVRLAGPLPSGPLDEAVPRGRR